MRVVTGILCAITVGSLVACTGSRPPTAEPAPSLAHVGDTQLKSSMWRLARQTGVLREILQTSTAPGPEERQAARSLLDEIGATVDELQTNPLTSPHPVLQAGLPAFEQDVQHARKAVDLEPPDYEPAIRLAGSCMRCHVVARAPGWGHPGMLAHR
jgi:uncharacterized membrane protein YccC